LKKMMQKLKEEFLHIIFRVLFRQFFILIVARKMTY